MNIMKKEKGVTIVALTVTVIMLIVLAGITINAVVGDNGILKTAEQTKENVEKSKVDVQTRLNEVYSTTRQSTNITYHSTEADEFKQKISEALTLKGVQTSPDEGAEAMAKKILDLETTVDMEAITEATAKKAEILSGKTAWVNGEKLTGAMPNFSSNIQTVNAAASNATTEVDITDGFHTKIKVNGKPAYDAGVTAGTAAGTAAAKVGTATAGDVLAGKTFTNSSKIGETGTMKNFSSNIQTVNAAANDTTTEVDITDGFHTKIKVNGKPAYDAGKAAGVTEGTAAAKVGTATAGDVLAGKTFTNSSKVGETGTMKNLSSSSIYQHNSGNTTKTIYGDKAFFTNVYNTSTKANMGNAVEIRYTGDPGYITSNTLFALAASNFGDAATENVLEGKYFTSTAGLKATGSMKNFSSNIQTVNAAASDATTEVDITDGFHTKIKVNGKPAYDAGVTAGTAAGTAAAKVGTATAGDVLAGKTFTNSSKIGETGTMATLTKDNFTGAHSSETAGEASNYTVTSSKAGYVPNGTQVASLAATTSPTIATTGETGTKTINVKPGYYNKISINQTAAYNAGNTAGVNATKVGTAEAGDVLAGKTFTNSSKVGETGTMVDNGAVTGSVGVGGTYKIDAGYHNGSGKVTGPTLSGTAAETDVLSGKTFYSNSGTKLTGKIVDIGTNATGTGIGSGGSGDTAYFAINGLPEGYYHKVNNETWAPEARIAKSKFGTATAAQVLKDKTFTSTAGVSVKGTIANVANDGVHIDLNGATGFVTTESGSLQLTMHDNDDILGKKYVNINKAWVRFPADKIASAIDLTAAKIAKGNTILGIAGTATGGNYNNLTYIESFGERTTKTFNDSKYVAYLFVVSAREKYRLDNAIKTLSSGGEKTEIVTSFVSGYGTGVRVFRIERTSAIKFTTGDATDWAAFGIK